MAQKQEQKKITRHDREAGAEEQPAEQPADQRDAELAADVACCLDDIDSALEDTEPEDEAIAHEFAEIKGRYISGAIGSDEADAELAVLQEKYAHRVLTIEWCCGMPQYTLG